MEALRTPRAPLTDGFVSLREFTRDDADAIVAACQDPEIPRWTVVPSPYTHVDALDWIESHDGLRAAAHAAPFAVVDAATGVLVGSMGIHDIDWRSRTGEVGYWVTRPMRRLGVATRALRLVSTYGFLELGLMRLILLADVRNEPSQAVARKAGFVQEGVLRSARELKGVRADMVLFSLLPSDAR